MNHPEATFPLRILICESCWLVQTEDFTSRESLFSHEYAYFSGFSQSWLTHCKKYVEDAVARFGLTSKSHVVEVASNDGSLLQYAHQMGIPSLGIEPTQSTAKAAREKGLEVLEVFFGCSVAKTLVAQGRSADLMAANNVLAHVPDINDFVGGFATLLKPTGVVSFEFPHLMRLVEEVQFDTIYHEHFSYLSLYTVQRILNRQGLQVFDVESLTTHGGSLRVWAQSIHKGLHPRHSRVDELLRTEASKGMQTANFYASFEMNARHVADNLKDYLTDCQAHGLKVAAYGAAAKGNTLLNYCEIGKDLLSFVVDRNPSKQGHFLPGSRLPIVAESVLTEERPDLVLILPWNLRPEITKQLAYIREWGGRFVTAIPELTVE